MIIIDMRQNEKLANISLKFEQKKKCMEKLKPIKCKKNFIKVYKTNIK